MGLAGKELRIQYGYQDQYEYISGTKQLQDPNLSTHAHAMQNCSSYPTLELKSFFKRGSCVVPHWQSDMYRKNPE